MIPIENEGGLIGVALFLLCSLGDGAFLGSSSVSESATGAIDVRCGGGTLLEISGVEWAYGVAWCIWLDGGSGGMAVMAPTGTFQSKKSGDCGTLSALNSNGICSISIGLDAAGGGLLA